jgi:CheY-like chemotaxis protein
MQNQSSETRHRTILVVDDHPLTRDLLTKTIENLGYGVIPSNTGSDAINMLEAHKSIPFDLAIVEINMHRVDGVEVAEYIRHLGLETKVVFTSDGAPRYTREIIEAMSPFPVLKKPLTNIPAVEELVQDLLSAQESAR